MKVNWARILIPIAMSLSPCAFGNPFDVGTFTTMRELEAIGEEAGEFGRFGLDADVYAKSARDFSDLRVLDEEGREVPVVVREKTEAEMGERWVATESEVVALDEKEGGAVEIVVRRPEKMDAAIEGISIRTALRDFEKAVVVEGSGDGVTWERLAGPVSIYDYHRYLDNVRSTRIRFGRSDHDQFRIRIEAAVEAVDSPVVKMIRESRSGVPFSETEHVAMQRRSFTMEGIDVLSVETDTLREATVTEQYEVADLEIIHDRDEGTTVATFSSGRVPLWAVVVSTDSKYHDRRVKVEGAPDGQEPEWVAVAETVIRSRAEVGGGESYDLRVGGGRRFSRIRVTVENGDSPPLKGLGFTVKGIAHEGVFHRARGSRHRLYYGSEAMKLPDYDIARVLDALSSVPTKTFALGIPEENPKFSGEGIVGDGVPGKAVLVTVIVVVALFLIVLVARMAGAVERATGPGAE